MDNALLFVFEKIVIPLSLLFMVGLLIYLPVTLYQEYIKDTFSLAKADWSCSRVYEYTTTSMIMVGKVMVPQILTHKDCIEWSHK